MCRRVAGLEDLMTRVAGLVVFAMLGVAVDKPAPSMGMLTHRG